MTTSLLSPGSIARLREALVVSGYTRHGVSERLGSEAVAVCGGVSAADALRHSTEPDRLTTLIRLFLCGRVEPAEAVAAALAPLDLAAAIQAGLVERLGTGVRAAVDLHPYGDWWVVADVRPDLRPERATPADHVMCAGPVSVELAGAVLRRPVATALDLGIGNGVQSLHLSRHAARVTGVDLSGRALRFAATTAALNGLGWELIEGDLVTPVADRRFDLVVCNPPFVVGPGRTTLLYQDSGRPGDGLTAELAVQGSSVLADGGYLQYVAGWMHVTGEDWRDRVSGWVPGGLDAWILQRSLADPASYVDSWLAQTHGATAADRDAWLRWFAELRVEAIGTGLVTLRRSGRDDPVVRIESLLHEFDPPLGTQVEAWFARQDWLRDHEPLDGRYVPGDGLTLWQAAEHTGPDGWRLDRQMLSLQAGLRWSEDADPLVVNVVGACANGKPLRDELVQFAVANDAAPEAVVEAAAPHIPHLVERGFLLPVDIAQEVSPGTG